MYRAARTPLSSLAAIELFLPNLMVSEVLFEKIPNAYAKTLFSESVIDEFWPKMTYKTVFEGRNISNPAESRIACQSR